MSYEGYEQYICANGHYSEADAYCSPSLCPVCGSETGWHNRVDETNGDSVGIIPLELLNEKFLISAEDTKICNLGHQHITQHAIYRVPSAKETKPLQHYYINNKGKLVLLNK